MQKKLLTEATLDEVRGFARLLGIDVDSRWKLETLIAKMGDYGLPVHDDAFQITVSSGGGFEPVSRGGVGSWRRLNDGRWEESAEGEPGARFGRTINVPTEEREGGDRPVYVSCNFRGMLIPRGKDVWVPIEYVRALDGAIREHLMTDEDGTVIGKRDVKRFPYNVVA